MFSNLVIHPRRHDRSQWIHVLDEMVEEHLDRSGGDHGTTTGADGSLQLPILRNITEQSQVFRKSIVPKKKLRSSSENAAVSPTDHLDFHFALSVATYYLEDYGRSHGREGSFQRADEVGRSWRWGIGGHVRRHGEVIHLVVEQDACAWRQDQ